MELFIVAALAVVVWCLAPLPLAVAIGRAFSHGSASGGDEHSFSALRSNDVPDGGTDGTPFPL